MRLVRDIRVLHAAALFALVGGVDAHAGLRVLAQGACPPRWVPTFGGMPGIVLPAQAPKSLAVFDDGGGHGPEIYAGGSRWDGASWRPAGDLFSGFVNASTVFDGGSGPELVAAGTFTAADDAPVGCIARWNGTEWSGLGGGLNGSASALAVFHDGSGGASTLYAGGNFTAAGGVPTSGIARWDGAAWSAVGTPGSMVVFALAVFDDGSGGGPALYAGGNFTAAGGVPASHIARWDGTSWSALGAGTDSIVRALVVFDDGLGGGPALYAGGQFTTAGGASASRIAKWDGTGWSPLGSGVNKMVRSLTVFDDGEGPVLCAGGLFDVAGGASTEGVAMWDGTSWLPLTGGVSAYAHALAVYDDGGGARLYAAESVNGHVVRWEDGWMELAHGGIEYATLGMAGFDDGDGAALYVALDAPVTSSHDLERVRKWDGASWSTLSTGMNGNASALAVFPGRGGALELHATGAFTIAGDASTNRIARWNGTTWGRLSSGLNSDGRALASFDDGSGAALFVGGRFTTAGGVAASRVARWNGTSWSALGGGVVHNGGSLAEVKCIEGFDDGGGPALFVGGLFTHAGGQPASHIARWDGTSWSALGSGTNGIVHDLQVFDDGSGPALFAGGAFTTAGGIVVNGVARWDGSNWSALAGGTSPQGTSYLVRALAQFDDGFGAGPALYAGGMFDAAGGTAASSIARWDGSSWAPLGRGLRKDCCPDFKGVYTLATFDDVDGPSLYAGSYGLVSVESGDGYLARWQGCDDTVPPVLSCPTAVHAFDRLGSPPGEVVHFAVLASDDLDLSPTVVCVPPSGSTFPRGTTLVLSTATDAAGNESTCEFPVHVGPRPRTR